ncbi:MAG: histidine phosphatase family protein [Gaiellaceae bacterium]
MLVRHAEPDPAVRGRCYGALDVSLSPEGRRRARVLAEALEGHSLAAVYASPRRRALETARPIAAAHGLTTVVDEDLRELDFGELEGRTYEEIAVAHPALYAAWMHQPTEVRFPGGESYQDLRRRVSRALAQLRARHTGDAVAVVAHGGVNRVVLAEALALPPEAVFRLGQDPGAVSVVDWMADLPLVRLVNAQP